MSDLRNRIDAQLADIEREIALIKERARADVEMRVKKREALVRARALLTAELENAIRALELAGIEVVRRS